MLEVPVYNPGGEQIDTLKVDERLFGGTVNAPLLKQAVVHYQTNRHQGSARTRGRSEVAGSTHKRYRQKGTGYARRGSIRTHLLRGGGVAFGKKPYRRRKAMPKRMRRAALDSAILAKIVGGDLLVVDGLEMTEPKTKQMVATLENLGIHRSCLLALPERDRNIYLSARNIEDLTVRVTEELNAYDVAIRQRMLVTSEAMRQLMRREGRDAG